MDKVRINLYKLLKSLGGALDLASPILANHHKQVAYLSCQLAKQMKLDDEKIKNIILAASIHDIGALSSNERIEIIESEFLGINHHAFRGAELLKVFKPLAVAADIVKYHHIPWENGKGAKYKGEDVSLESHIVHLADRIATKLNGKDLTSHEVRRMVIDWAKKNSGQIFVPEVVDALSKFEQRESIWLDIITSFVEDDFEEIVGSLSLDLNDIKDIAFIFSKTIDFRSEFTAKHSAGVARSAQVLAMLAGFSEVECEKMLIAGYLHDLGKLAISDEILEKRGALNASEVAIIRSHTYYTYRLLGLVPEFIDIKKWAAFHHERLDGKGYPFQIKGPNLPLGSRIMAVADIYTAIKEDRPYRQSMPDSEAKVVLLSMVASGALDGRVVQLLVDNFDLLEKMRMEAQASTYNLYEEYVKAELKSKE